VEWFDIAAVGKGAARFDLKKLLSLNGHYLREADDARLASLVAPRLGPLVADQLALLERAMPVLKVRAADLDELARGSAFLIAQRPLALDPKAEALLTGEARALLALVAARIALEPRWTSETLEATLKAMAEEHNLGLGKLAQPLRAALTGQATSPGIFDVLTLLGKDEALARIRDQVPRPDQ
jgi:glutamyl-tRNA synthetase